MVERSLPVIPAGAGIQGYWVALEYMSVMPWSPSSKGQGLRECLAAKRWAQPVLSV
jgi:hypothetical protein